MLHPMLRPLAAGIASLFLGGLTLFVVTLATSPSDQSARKIEARPLPLAQMVIEPVPERARAVTPAEETASHDDQPFLLHLAPPEFGSLSDDATSLHWLQTLPDLRPQHGKPAASGRPPGAKTKRSGATVRKFRTVARRPVRSPASHDWQFYIGPGWTLVMRLVASPVWRENVFERS